MRAPEIDSILAHWSAKLPRTNDPRQRQAVLNLIDTWLDARHAVTLTIQLEQDWRR